RSESTEIVRMLRMAAVEKRAMTRMAASNPMVGMKRRAAKTRSFVSKENRSGLAFFLVRLFGLNAIFLHPPVESATAKAEGFCRLAHVPVGTLQGFADENTLNGLQAHLLQSLANLTRDAGSSEPKIDRFDLAATRHEDGALDGVVQLAHIA